MLIQRHRSPSRSLVQLALAPALVLLLVSVAIPVTMSAAREPTFPITSTGDTTGQTSNSAVIRTDSGTILQAGNPITLPVEAVNVQNLAAVTVMVSYDPAVLRVAGCQCNPAFETWTKCNTQLDDDGDSQPDAVVFNMLSWDGLSAGEGAPLNLANIAWGVAGTPDPGTVSTLIVEVLTFADPFGIPISRSAENGQITVGITRVTISDIMLVAANWGQPATGGNAQLDLVLDGTIDVQDVSALAGHWRGTWP